MSKVFIDDGYPEGGLYQLMDQWKGKVVDRHVEEEIGITRNPDIVALVNDPKSWVKTSPFSKMRQMTPEANAESMRLHELETNAYQGYEVWSETNSVDEEFSKRSGDILDTNYRSNFQNQFTVKYPHAPDPHGYYTSITEKTIDDGSGRIDDYHELRQKLIPATDDPFGEYVGLQNEVVVNPNMPSYADGVIPDTEVRSVDGEDSRVNLYEAKLIDDFGSVGETMVKDIGSGDIGPDGMRRHRMAGPVSGVGGVSSGDFEFGAAGIFRQQAKLAMLKKQNREKELKEKKLEARQRAADITKAGTGIYKGLSALDMHKKGKTESFTGKFDIGGKDMNVFEKTEDAKLGGFSPFKGVGKRLKFTEEFENSTGMDASQMKTLKTENPKLWKMMKKKGYGGDESSMTAGSTFRKESGGLDSVLGKSLIPDQGDSSAGLNERIEYGRSRFEGDETGVGKNVNFVKDHENRPADNTFAETAELRQKELELDTDQWRAENPDIDVSTMSQDEIVSFVDKWKNRTDEASETDYEEQYKVEEGTDRGRTTTEDQNAILPIEGPEKDWGPKGDAERIKNEDIQKMQEEYPGSNPGDLEKWYEREGKFGEGNQTASTEEMTFEDAKEYMSGDTSSSVEKFIPDMDNAGLERDAALIQDTDIIESLAVDPEAVKDIPVVDASTAANSIGEMAKGAAKNKIMEIGMNVGGDMLVDAGMDPEVVDTGKDVYSAAKTVKSAYDTVKTAKAAKDVGTAAVGAGGGAMVPGLNIAAGAFQVLTADEPADKIAGGVTALGGALMFTPLAPLGAVMVAGSSLWSIFS